jgi:RNA polymerase sigma factor (sigma-70 family)
MEIEELLRSNLSLVERVVRRVCRRANVVGADVDDFASTVKLALIENDYAVLRAHEGRSSLATYLAVVIQRLLADERNRSLGRWRASAEAQKLGPTAVLLETLLGRDRRALDEAIPIVRAVDPTLTRADLEAIAARLPQRTSRPRAVELDEAETLAAPDKADARVAAGELHKQSDHAGVAIRNAMASLPLQDRMLIRLRFVSNMDISDIARILQLPQRPMYRRLEQILAMLRRTLAESGIEAGTASDLIGSAVVALDFGLTEGKSEPARQSPVPEESKRLEGLT